jgi:hydroxypyruvate isomerase
MNRRRFVGAALAAPSLLALEPPPHARAPGAPFRLKFAPHFGMFRHHAGDDPLDQLEFLAAEGFRALEDNGMAGRPPAEQERLGRRMEELGIEMGVFVAHADFGAVTFASREPEATERIETDMRRASRWPRACGQGGARSCPAATRPGSSGAIRPPT